MLRVKAQELTLAEELRAARDAANLSQVELARQLEVSPRTIQGWEAGRIPQPKHRRAVLDFIGEQTDPVAA